MRIQLLFFTTIIMTLFMFTGCSTRTLIIKDNMVYERSNWDELTDFEEDDLRNVKVAFLRSCQKISSDPLWEDICLELRIIPDEERDLKKFFKNNFEPFLIVNTDSDNEGLITGYYQPLLHGSRTKKPPYIYPLYNVPKDTVVVDSTGKRMRVTKTGKKVECYSRAEIESKREPLRGEELLWVDNKIDSFFLHIQGSGLVQLDTGEIVSVGYAGKNSLPYVAIGKVLVENDYLDSDEVSMQSIRKWLDENQEKCDSILQQNPSYVFFREIDTIEPYGSLGVPVTAKRTLAVDPEYIPMGYPLYLETENHEGDDFNRLMFAQDKGGAIKGRVRADIYFGFGKEAEYLAGHMQGDGKIWVLIPKTDNLVELSKIKD